MKTNILLLVVVLMLFLSCEKADEKSISQSGNYKLVITDSIQIDRMVGYQSIISTHPENGNLLMIAIEGEKEMIFIVSQEGEIVKEFEYPKEGPTSAGSRLMSVNFYEDGYVIMGYGNIVIYDTNFNVKKRFDIPLTINNAIYMHTKNLKVIERDGKSYFLILYAPSTQRSYTEAEYYKEFNLLTLVDPENETFEPYGQFHEGSMFRSGKAFYFMYTFFEVIEDKTKAIVSNDTVLYTFDNSGNELNRVSVPFDLYYIFKGHSLGVPSREEQSKVSEEPGIISGLYYVDGMDVISYKSGFSLDIALDLFGPNRERFDRNEVDKANPQKVIILKDGQLVSEVLSLPEKILTLGVSDSFGNIWATQNVAALDEEPDVVTFYKLRIQAK